MQEKEIRKKVRNIIKESFLVENEAIRLKFNIPIPEDILNIKNILKEKGYKLYVVGGAVRDAYLGKQPKDYDLATDALPDAVQEALKPYYKTLETGKAFGVINVLTQSGEYEIATFRKDRYKDDDLEGFKKYLKSLNNGTYEKFVNKFMR